MGSSRSRVTSDANSEISRLKARISLLEKRPGSTNLLAGQQLNGVLINGGPIKGGNVSVWQTDSTTGDPTVGIGLILANISALGLDTVTIPVRVTSPNATSNTATVDSTSLAYAHTLRNALPGNLRVIIEPYPWINSGTVSETDWNPASYATWFTNWQAACVAIATSFPSEYAMYIASNLVNLDNHPSDWNTLITAVRAAFAGKIAYRLNWWNTATFAPSTITDHQARVANYTHLANIDILAFAGYFELTDTVYPQLDELKACISNTTRFSRNQNIYQEIQDYYRQYGKPWWFGELAVSHFEEGAQEPWNSDPSATYAQMMQARYYRAYVEEMSSAPGFCGFSIFNIGHPYGDSGYLLAPSAVQYLKSVQF